MYDVKTNVKILDLNGQNILDGTLPIVRGPYNQCDFLIRGSRVFIKDWDKTNGEWLVFVEGRGSSIDDLGPKNFRDERDAFMASEAAILQKKKDKKAAQDNPEVSE